MGCDAVRVCGARIRGDCFYSWLWVGMVMSAKLNRGAVWPNDNKKDDNSPDYKGQANLDGVEAWVNMWIDPEAQRPYPPITFSLSRKEVQPEAPPKVSAELEEMKQLARGPDTEPADKDKPFDDDIPF